MISTILTLIYCTNISALFYMVLELILNQTTISAIIWKNNYGPSFKISYEKFISEDLEKRLTNDVGSYGLRWKVKSDGSFYETQIEVVFHKKVEKAATIYIIQYFQ